MKRTITSLAQAKELSLTARDSVEHSADFTIEVEGQAWKCYTAAIANRDILCYCDEGTATFLVDTYGTQNTVELVDWNVES